MLRPHHLLACLALFVTIAGCNRGAYYNYKPVVYTEADTAETQLVYMVTEQQATFPGGDEMLFKALKVATPVKGPVEGKAVVFVECIISKRGQVQDVRTIRNPFGPEAERVALETVRALPNWSPARMSGKAVRCKVQLPVRMRLVE